MTHFSTTWLRPGTRCSLAALALLTAGAAQAQTFAAQATFAAGSGPNSVAAADVNGDGKPDLLVANYGSGTVSVLLNTTVLGAGTASFAAQATFATSTGPFSVAAADVNGDGKPDLLVANYGSANVGVLLNTTAAGATMPTFAAQATFAAGTNPSGVAAADVNGDNKPDLLVANRSSGTVGVLLNTTAAGAATPSFSAQATFTAGSGPNSVAAADVNGDNKPDLLVANNSSGTVSVLLNTTATGAATPSFSAQATFTIGSSPQSVATADVNGDGKPDLLVAGSGVSVLLNATATGATTPGFAAPVSSATGIYPSSIAAADVDGDGKPDPLVANAGSQTVGVLRNTTATGATTASFAVLAIFSTGNTPQSVAAADVNGDGKPDLLTANYGSANVGVLLNTTVLATRAALPGTSATLAPNPARTAATLALTGLPVEARAVAATLHNSVGQVVRRLLLPAAVGTATATVPTAGLPTGVYLLQAQALDAHGTTLGMLPTQRLMVE